MTDGQNEPQASASAKSAEALATDPDFQQSLLNAINDASPEGIVVIDGNGTIVSYNQQIIDLWRIPPGRMRGVHVGSAIGTVDDPLLAGIAKQLKDPVAFRDRVRELHYSPELDDHCELELKDGRTLERDSTALRGKHGQYLGRVWFYRDITPWKEAQAKLEALARQDPLTGVMNRRYFDERAKLEFARAVREQKPVAIVEFDLDFFKQVNDRHGHATGDELLKVVCDTCRAIVRETSLFARIGGEEFAVLLAGANLKGALIFAERLREAVAAARLNVNGEMIAATISVGVAMRHAADTTPEECLLRADKAMYLAKSRGRNRVEVAD
ncbi:MAG: diguanylate cyclase [Gemmatimonadota bacterium]